MNMDFVKKLWMESFKEWSFFYDLHEKDLFNKESYNQLLQDISAYKYTIKENELINKNIVKMLYVWINIFWGKNNMFHDKEISILWVKNWDEFNDYLDELNFEIMQLLSIEK